MSSIWNVSSDMAEDEKVTHFEKLIADSNVLAIFTADWCIACQALEPIIWKIKKEIDIKDSRALRIIFLDVPNTPSVATHYKVSALPTLILFINGLPVTRLSGTISEGKMRKRLQEHIQNIDIV